MIYEFFSFLNEYDMLELKLQEHSLYVDQFVITEANRTFNGIPREYSLRSQWDRYQPWHHKITVLEMDVSHLKPGWAIENAQMNYGSEQIRIRPKDIAILTDLDEFLRPQDWQWITDNINSAKREILFDMQAYWCFANVQHSRKHRDIAAVLGSRFVDAMTHRRSWRETIAGPLPHTTIRAGGLHFTWFGDQETFTGKMQGSIEAYNWCQGHDPAEVWKLKQENRLFHWKRKFERRKMSLVPIDTNPNFTESMQKFIKQRPEWIYEEKYGPIV
jgi:hypothetical protein